jgi:hypothetical protein
MGTPEQVARHPTSYPGQALRRFFAESAKHTDAELAA